jgi:nicotinamidase-related amidase
MVIIFAQHCYRNGKHDKNLKQMRPCCIEGSGGEDLDPMLPVDVEKDYVIKKRRYSAFFGTDLDLVLREHGIEKLIITGTKTNCCIRATVTDAYYLEYVPVVLRDCVATNSDTVNQVHLDDIEKYFGIVISSDELFEKIREGLL